MLELIVIRVDFELQDWVYKLVWQMNGWETKIMLDRNVRMQINAIHPLIRINFTMTYF